MIIIGAGGFAKEVLEILHQNNETDNLCFYDDYNSNVPKKLYDKFLIYTSLNEVEEHFKTISNKFIIGIGNPELRKKLFCKFNKIGGEFISSVSKYSDIGSYNVNIGSGCNILSGVKISNNVNIGIGNIIYYNSIITHDVLIGDFCEISPSVNILGRVSVGNYCKIGTGAILFPGITVGDYSVIAAGAVVRNNVPKNVMVAGIPAIIKKEF